MKSSFYTALLVALGLSSAQAFSSPATLGAIRNGHSTFSQTRPNACGLQMQAVPSMTRRQAFEALLVPSTAALALASFPLEVGAKATKASAEDVVAAFGKVKGARENLAKADEFVSKKDYEGLKGFLSAEPYSDIEQSLLILVNGPVLNADDKKTIGTRKRYGIAADVIYGVGGVQGAIDNIENPQIESCSAGICSGNFVDVDAEVLKSLKGLKASLSEILQICKAYKELQ